MGCNAAGCLPCMVTHESFYCLIDYMQLKYSAVLGEAPKKHYIFKAGKTMQAFKAIKDTFDEVYGSLPVPVFLFDGQAQMVKANRAFLELSKADADRLPQLSISDFFNVLKTFRFPVPDRYVTELMSSDGKAIPVALNYTKFQGDDEESSNMRMTTSVLISHPLGYLM